MSPLCQSHLLTDSSPAPWGYEYNPYQMGDGPDAREIPAFEIFDDCGNKVFDTNEDLPVAMQEANARLAAAAPALLEALSQLVPLCRELLSAHPNAARRLAVAEAAIRLASDGER